MAAPTHPADAAREPKASDPTAERSLSLDEQRLEEIIPVAEEVAHIAKREVTTGRVRVRTVSDVVQETVRATLEEDTVDVIRVPIDREITEAPQVRTENGVTIVPVVEEVLVVEKRLVLKEELHIRRQTRIEEVDVPVELRRQRVEIERLPADTATLGAPDEE